jgi:hypothetical protein
MYVLEIIIILDFTNVKYFFAALVAIFEESE